MGGIDDQADNGWVCCGGAKPDASVCGWFDSVECSRNARRNAGIAAKRGCVVMLSDSNDCGSSNGWDAGCGWEGACADE